MGKKTEKPIYFIPPDHPLIEKYEILIDHFSPESANTLLLSIDPWQVDNLNGSFVAEIMMVMQHHPHLLEKAMLSFEFKFLDVPDSELYIPEEGWKTDSKYYRWFHCLSQFPHTLFFIHDKDARFYFLTGDILSKGDVQVSHLEGRKDVRVEFVGEQMETFANRLFDACMYLHVYCHGSGYNPRQLIEAVLADYKIDIPYKAIHKEYMDLVKKGIEFRVEAKEEGEADE